LGAVARTGDPQLRHALAIYRLLEQTDEKVPHGEHSSLPAP
jgi:hypothetical protein